MLTEERIEESPTHRPARWLMVAAAAVAAIVVGFVITSSGSDEEPAPADQPAPTPAATTIPDDPGGQSPELAINAAIGDEFMAAMAALDADAAGALVSADGTIDVGPDDDLDLAFAWFSATGFRFEPEACSAFEGGHVNCELTQANLWSNAVDADPVRARVSMAIENGEITRLVQTEEPSWFLAVDPFFEYVLENHPDDAASMWALDPAGEERTGLILDERSIELFARYSQEYLEAMSAES